MTQQETKNVLSVLRASFPNFYRNMKTEDQMNLLLVWSDMFEEDDPMLVMAAVKSYIRSNTSQFPPSVGQIVDLMHKLSNPIMYTEQEAWNMVYKACCNSIYHSEEEFEKLPREVQQIVGSPNQLKVWATTDNQELNTVVSSNFMRSYRSRVAQNKEHDMLSESVKTMISEIVEQKRIGEVTNDD